MNRTETSLLLRVRRELTHEQYSDATVDAWAKNLAAVDERDALTAMHVVARRGRVSIADLTVEIDRTRPREELRGAPIEPRDCGCPDEIRDDQGHPMLCYHEIERGQFHTARILAELAARKAPIAQRLDDEADAPC